MKNICSIFNIKEEFNVKNNTVKKHQQRVGTDLYNCVTDHTKLTCLFSRSVELFICSQQRKNIFIPIPFTQQAILKTLTEAAYDQAHLYVCLY